MAEEEETVIDPEKILGVYVGGKNEHTGEREGQGVNRFPNGDIYKGEYFKGQRNGSGKYFWKLPNENVAKYAGKYENHKKEGYGVMKYPDGSKYDGNFHLGKRHGEGIYTYPNGDVYKGSWEDGKKHGQGTFFFKKDKCTYVGIWKQGQIIRGIWNIKDGSYYTGKFDKQRPNIEGRYVTVNGNSVTGIFKEQTKTIEVPIEKEKKAAEEEEEQTPEEEEPQFKKVEKIVLRQFIPQTFSQSTPEQVQADNYYEIIPGELDVPKPPPPPEKKEGEEEEAAEEQQ